MSPEVAWLIGLVQGMLLAIPVYLVADRAMCRLASLLSRDRHDGRR